jgi:hypothetical protein
MRTANEIQQQVIGFKNQLASLSRLTDEKDIRAALSEFSEVASISKVSEWRLWTYIIAWFGQAQDVLFDDHKGQIATLTSQAILSSSAWLVQKAKEFQYGDDLEIDPETYQPSYPVIDPEKQIISRSAVATNGVQAVLKLAKSGGVLSAPEMTAFRAYLNDLTIPGQNITAVSLAPDLLKIAGSVYYDGNFTESAIRAAVENAVALYQADLPFDGTVLKNGVVDAVQKVDGVFDIEVTTFEFKPDGGTYAAVPRAYQTAAGYFEIDGSFPLSTQLTYVPS